MKIKELNILEFGCLKDKVIGFDDGMNIIYGENETGKSTILLFIKFILYGLGRRSTANTERERSISWSGHVAAGSMTFSHKEKNYRIERRFATSEKLSIVCLDDGSEIITDKTPGEYFLGVPRETFESSACVGQMRSADINGEKTASSIRNMLVSADENVDTAKILKNLDAVRVTYLHKNKTGGKLYEDEQRMIQKRRLLEASKENASLLEIQTERLERATREYEAAKVELDKHDALFGELNKISLVKDFDLCAQKNKERDELLAARADYLAKNLKTDFLPDSQHIAELKISASHLDMTEEILREKEEKLSELGDAMYDEALIGLGERVEREGGVEAILLNIQRKEEAIKRSAKTSLALCVLFVCLCAISIPLLIFGQYWGAAFLGFAIPAVAVCIVGLRKKKAILGEINDIAGSYGTTPDQMRQKLYEYVENLSRYRSYSAYLSTVNAEIDQARRSFASAKAALDALLGLSLCEYEVSSFVARTEQARLEEIIAAVAQIDKSISDIDVIIESKRELLSAYDEQRLRSEISVDVNLATPEALAKSEENKRFYSAKVMANYEKINYLKGEIIRLKAGVRDPIAIADELAELEERNRRERDYYDALTLAMEAISEAGKTMNGSIIPAISRAAGEIMGRISDQRYTTLRATGELGLSVDSDGFSVKTDFLSAGTKDAAYLSLRIALFMRIFGEELPPLILDEALCQFDDVRTGRVLTMLGGFSTDNTQCLLFTSHNRELDICDRQGIEYNKIVL